MQRSLISFLVCLSVAAFVSGCGGGSSDVPELGDVSGTAKVDGKPTPNLNVSFQPEDGRPSYGTTDSSGKYTLTYTADENGAKIGKNLVTISTAEEGDDGCCGCGDEEENENDETGEEAASLDGMSVTADEPQVEISGVEQELAQNGSALLVPPVEIVDVEDEPTSLRDEGQ